jgi:hypothetical protein
MSERQPNSSTKFQFNLRKSLYGWTCAALSLVACACLTWWLAAITTSRAELPFILIGRTAIGGHHGWITLFRSPPDEPRSGQAINYDGDLPGISWHTFWVGGKPRDWYVSVSAIIPFVVSLLGALFCFWRYRETC